MMNISIKSHGENLIRILNSPVKCRSSRVIVDKILSILVILILIHFSRSVIQISTYGVRGSDETG